MRVINLVATLLLLALWGIPLYFYGALPERMPVHFNLAGDADRWGTKSTIWLLPMIGALIYFGFGWLSRHPEKLNYLKPVTSENAARQYANGVQLLVAMRCVVLALFLLLTVNAVRIGLHHDPLLHGNGWGIAILLGIIALNWYFLAKNG